MFRQQPDSPPPIEPHSVLASIFKQDAVAAGLLLLAALCAILLVNLGYGEPYHALMDSDWGVTLWGFSFHRPLHFWINDGLMAVFFFLVGLEIKRELLAGELASLRKAALPGLAALGGMLAPALIYTAFNGATPEANGWGIPMATDIAFAIGCMSLLGRRVPVGLTVFLLALAIADDLGSVLVIALFYTGQIEIQPLLIGAALIALSWWLARMHVRIVTLYIAIWIGVWLTFLQSGVHATIAGVLVAFTIPTRARYRTPLFYGRMRTLLARFRDAEDNVHPLLVNARQQDLIRAILHECRYVEAPLQRVERALHPLAMLFIMPLFAFANSGVIVNWATLRPSIDDTVQPGVFLGLLAGKQLGIMLFSWAAVRLRVAQLPEGVTWGQMYGLSWLAGIGFTVSLFISQLAFHDRPEALDQAKTGIFLASLVGGIVGYSILRRLARNAA